MGATSTASAAVVAAAFSSAASVPVTSDGYLASGNTVDLTLGFTPTPRSTLTVVNNTGLGFINGAFDNAIAHDIASESLSAVAEQIDGAVRALVEEAHSRAREILEQKRAALDALAALLEEKEVIGGAEAQAVLQAHP